MRGKEEKEKIAIKFFLVNLHFLEVVESAAAYFGHFLSTCVTRLIFHRLIVRMSGSLKKKEK